MPPIDFLDKYFINPILTDSGYNLVNTITYAIIAIIALYVIYKVFKKANLKFDFKFFLATLPFIFFGASTRSFVDIKYLEIKGITTFLFISPGIYLFTAFLFFVSLALGIHLQKTLAYKNIKLEYWKTAITAGIILNIALYYSMRSWLFIDEPKGTLAILIIFTAIATALFAFFEYAVPYLKIKYNKFKTIDNRLWTTNLSLAAIFGQLFDATNTFYIVKFYNAMEKHPLPRFLIDTLGPASFLIVKLLIVIPAVYLIQKETKDKELASLVLIAIAVLGFAEGLRNLLTLFLGT